MIQNQNDLVMYILERSVNVLDWENTSLNKNQVDELHKYLTGFTARKCLRHSDEEVLAQALHLLSRENIDNYLKKIGIERQENSTVFIIGGKEKHNESDIVNMIRRTHDLHVLGQDKLTPLKRRRSNDPSSLSMLQNLVLRIWAVKSNAPLSNMPQPSTIGAGNWFQTSIESDATRIGPQIDSTNNKEAQNLANPQMFDFCTPQKNVSPACADDASISINQSKEFATPKDFLHSRNLSNDTQEFSVELKRCNGDTHGWLAQDPDNEKRGCSDDEHNEGDRNLIEAFEKVKDAEPNDDTAKKTGTAVRDDNSRMLNMSEPAQLDLPLSPSMNSSQTFSSLTPIESNLNLEETDTPIPFTQEQEEHAEFDEPNFINSL